MIADTFLLLTLRLQVEWNTFRSRKLIRQILIVVLFLAVGAVMISFASGFGYGAGAILRRFPRLQLEPLMPGLILGIVTLLSLASSFGVALSALFLSNDLELLMSAPVNRRAVFMSKILDGMMGYYVLVMATAMPALFTYGLGLRYGLLYYLLAFVAVLATPLLPAGLGALLVMVVARFAPARRVREVMGLAAALFGVTCSLISNLSRSWSRLAFLGDQFNLEALLTLTRSLINLPIPPLMAGRGLAAAGVGEIGSAFANMAGFLLLTFGLFAAIVWLADTLYASGWVRMQSSGSANRNKQRAEKAAARSGLLGSAPASFALALKDWRVIPRDLRNFAQFLAPLFLLPVIYINLLGGGGSRSFNAVAQANNFAEGRVNFSNAFAAAGVLTVTFLIFNRIASTGISMEGKSWWLLKTAPLAGRELLAGKFLAALMPFTAIGTALMIGMAIWRGFSVIGALYGWLGMMVLGSGMMAVDVGLAVPWANLTWDDPRRMSSGWGALFSFFINTILGLVAGLLLALPLIARAFLPAFEIIAWLVGPLGAIAVSSAIGGLVVQFGLSRLSSVGEA
ncbi:MAG: hypothetical protein HYZ49_10145 [Chloroflexi bacterium]|nr:hypothetical protein [Chloroflexota bacterium]